MGFQQGGSDLEANTTPQPIRDAILHYDVNPGSVSLRAAEVAGQPPAGVASNNLQLIDGSIVTSSRRWTAISACGSWKETSDGVQPVIVKGAITSGKGATRAR